MDKKLILQQQIERDAWDQLDDEPDSWFYKFSQFRLLGPRRSMRKVYRIWREEKYGQDMKEHTAPAIWAEKAKQYHWVERAHAWDVARLEEKEEEAEKVYSEGLSLAHNRVDHLKKLAQKMEDYLLDKRTTRLSPHLIEQLRGTYDDIAKELGQRVKETRLTGPGGGPVEIVTAWGRGGSATDAWKETQIVEGTKVESTPNDEERGKDAR